MNQTLVLIGLLALFGGIGLAAYLFSRRRCPRCDAVLPSSAYQCPQCGQLIGTAGSAAEGPPRYCPQCRAEYRAGVAVCPDCEITLVGQLPPDEADREAEFNRGPRRTLCPVLTPEEADFILTVLAEQNLRAILLQSPAHRNPEEVHAPDTPLVSVGVGEIAVGEKDLPRAKEILAALEADSEAVLENCPSCDCGEADCGSGYICDECGADVGPTDPACPKCGVEFEGDED